MFAVIRHAPLEGIRVLDLTRAVAGPFCSMVLGDLGARIIKIEEPGHGDEARGWGPPFVQGDSAYFLALNRNKESVTLDLKHGDDRSVLRRLVRDSDIFVQNFRPGVVERLGIDYETLRQQNPRLIYGSISGFGLDGPEKLKPGYDLIIQAMSGMMLANAGLNGEPVKTGFPVADVLAGQFICQAVLAALYERERSGLGTHVEVSLLDSLLAAMGPVSAAFLTAGEDPDASGSSKASVAPYQVFRCRDARIAVGVPNERIWQRFCSALGKAEWTNDKRYATNADRVHNRAELTESIETVLGERTGDEWLRVLERHGVPCGPVLSMAQILRHPQVVARGTVVEVDHPKLGRLKMVGSPIRFDDMPLAYKPPPRLGEHTAALLEELSATEERDG